MFCFNSVHIYHIFFQTAIDVLKCKNGVRRIAWRDMLLMSLFRTKMNTRQQKFSKGLELCLFLQIYNDKVSLAQSIRFLEAVTKLLDHPSYVQIYDVYCWNYINSALKPAKIKLLTVFSFNLSAITSGWKNILLWKKHLFC